MSFINIYKPKKGRAAPPPDHGMGPCSHGMGEDHRPGASASWQASPRPCSGQCGTEEGSGAMVGVCYGAGETLQCMFLPKNRAVAKEHVAKAKGSTHASEHR